MKLHKSYAIPSLLFFRITAQADGFISLLFPGILPSSTSSSTTFSTLNPYDDQNSNGEEHTTQHDEQDVDVYHETYTGNRMMTIDTRRSCLQKTAVFSLAPITSSFSPTRAFAATGSTTTNDGIQTFQKNKSRTEGYKIQHTKSEWIESLSIAQLNVLRKGLTERQRSSVLDKEKRNGVYACAGCNELVFSSDAKFDSGTGWPSFDSPISVDAVEIEEVNWVQSMDGAEVRCHACGSHLGDVFPDGWRYGSKTGKRYCINGAALVFRPMDGGDGKELRGDIPPQNKVIQYEPALRRD